MGISGPVEGVKVAIVRNAEVSVCFLGLTDCDDDQLASTVPVARALYELVVRPELRSWAPKGFSVRVSRPASPGSTSRPSSYQQLETLVEEQTIPDIILWDRRPVITEDRGLLLVETVLPSDGSRRGTSVFVADDGSYSRFPTADGAVDARLIADRSTLVSSYFARSTSGVSYRGSLVRPSRGRPCTFGPTAKALEPCPFTTGASWTNR